jgi:hypothetical protein
MKRYPEAGRDFDEAIRLDPKHHEAYYRRGRVFGDQGLQGGGAIAFRRANCVPTTELPQSSRVDAGHLSAGRVPGGPKAVEHATRACELTEWKDGNILDTLRQRMPSAVDSPRRSSGRRKRRGGAAEIRPT